jgi:predicted ATPase
LRLEPQLLLRQALPEAQAAEACFQQALEVARRQQAKSWELRAAMSLARLWQQQGKGVEACTLLAESYSWFTEGFDTADLQEAKVLLEELGG